MTESTAFYSDEILQVAFWRNVTIIDISGDISADQMRIVGRAYRTLLMAHSGGVVGLCTIRAGVPVASADARAESVRFTKELGNAVLAVVMVIEDSGIFSHVMRNVIRGINVMTQSSKLVAVATVDEGIKAVLPHVRCSREERDVSGDLRSVVTAIRTRARPSQKLKQAR